MKKKLDRNYYAKLARSRLLWLRIILVLLIVVSCTLAFVWLDRQKLRLLVSELEKKNQNPVALNDKQKMKTGYNCENPQAEAIAPLCPQGQGHIILPKTFPIHTLYIGYDEDISATGAFQSILNIAFSLESRIKIVVIVPKERFNQSKQEIQSILSSKNSEWVEIVPVPSTYTTWAQDYFENVVNLNDGSYSLVDLPYESGEGEHIPTSLALACDAKLIGQSEVDADKISQSPGNYGGNIEALTERLVVVGDNIHPMQYKKLSSFLSQDIIKIAVKWLFVGHVDELFSVLPVKGRKGECPFDVLYASPRKALELLKLESMKEGSLNYQMRSGSKSKAQSFLLRDCFDKGKKMNEVCTSLIRSNQTYAKIIRRNIQILKKELRSQHSNCKNTKFVEIPVLFTAKNHSRVYGTSEDHAISIDPNPVNNILIGNNLLLPKQNMPVFHEYTVKTLEPYGYSTLYLDGKYVHHFKGGLHCSVNFRRSCRVR